MSVSSPVACAPSFFSILSDVTTPVALFHRLSQLEPYAFLLEGVEGDSQLARYSFLGIDPVLVARFQEASVTLTNRQTNETQTLPCQNPLAFLQNQLALYTKNLPSQKLITSVPFTGGWVGYLGYGATVYFDGIEKPANDVLNVPDAYYCLYDSVLVFDHLRRRLELVSHRKPEAAAGLWQHILQPTSTTEELEPLTLDTTALIDLDAIDSLESAFSGQVYCDKVAQAKALVEAGEVFQLILSNRYSLPYEGEPINVYRALSATNPSPYAYFLKFPEFSYLGSSPETFVRCIEGDISLRALAGTRPRGRDAEEDLLLEAELKSNEKEMAEHRMLIDLGRNDLGRVCKTGSIQVFSTEVVRYSHVMHLSTKIEGKLSDEQTVFSAFQACFPQGTVSGAPKIRAMQHIAKLEEETRGIFAGVVGYFDLYGNTDGAIAIRSALLKDGKAHIQAGAGIVYDSNPLAEYEETRNKAKNALQAVVFASNTHGISQPEVV